MFAGCFGGWQNQVSGSFVRAAAGLALAVWLVVGGAPAALHAQDAATTTSDADAAKAAGSSATTTDDQPKEQSLLSFFIEALGTLYMVVFASLSFVLVAFVVMNFLAMRRDSIVPTSLVENFEAMLNEKRYQEAYELAKNDESFLGQVLSAGLAKLQSGYPQAIEAMQEVGEEESMKLEHRLSYVALIGTLAPMIGLFGTVHGMVDSFRVIAAATTQPKPAQLAQGISKALITTLIGLLLAIPAIAIFGILKNRMSRLILEVGILSEGLMSRFSSVGGKKQG